MSNTPIADPSTLSPTRAPSPVPTGHAASTGHGVVVAAISLYSLLTFIVLVRIVFVHGFYPFTRKRLFHHFLVLFGMLRIVTLLEVRCRNSNNTIPSVSDLIPPLQDNSSEPLDTSFNQVDLVFRRACFCIYFTLFSFVVLYWLDIINP